MKFKDRLEALKMPRTCHWCCHWCNKLIESENEEYKIPVVIKNPDPNLEYFQIVCPSCHEEYQNTMEMEEFEEDHDR